MSKTLDFSPQFPRLSEFPKSEPADDTRPSAIPASSATRYIVALLVAVISLLLRALLTPLLGADNPYHTAWAAVVFSAWYCGLGPSVVTTLISMVGVWHWFLPPLGSLTFQHRTTQVFGGVGFLALSGFIIALGEANRRSKARSERETAERLRTDREFKVFANSMPELCWMARSDGHIFWYSDRWYEYTGTTPEKMAGWGWQSVHHPEILPSVLERWKTSIQTGQSFEMEFPLRGADGVFRWFLTRIRPVTNNEGGIVRWFGTNTNIQQQRELRQSLMEAHQELEKRVQERTVDLDIANQNLRQLSGRLLQLQDHERRRFARELHDSTGQLLAAIKMNIAIVQSTLLDAAAAKAVSESASLIDRVLVEIRTISHLLHPPLLDEVGLPSALRWYVDEFSQRSQIAVSLDIPDDIGRLGSEMEIAIFRVIQECLTNVHRHSGSRTAALRLVQEEMQVRLEITDAGKGIPLEKQLALCSSGRLGVGLRGMRERVAQLGGVLEVQSGENGTLVRAILPIENAAAIAASEEVAI